MDSVCWSFFKCQVSPSPFTRCSSRNRASVWRSRCWQEGGEDRSSANEEGRLRLSLRSQVLRGNEGGEREREGESTLKILHIEFGYFVRWVCVIGNRCSLLLLFSLLFIQRMKDELAARVRIPYEYLTVGRQLQKLVVPIKVRRLNDAFVCVCPAC